MRSAGAGNLSIANNLWWGVTESKRTRTLSKTLDESFLPELAFACPRLANAHCRIGFNVFLSIATLVSDCSGCKINLITYDSGSPGGV